MWYKTELAFVQLPPTFSSSQQPDTHTRMPPKGSTKKRTAAEEGDGAANREQDNGSGSASLRRSTRGGGHPAAAEKPAPKSKNSSSNSSNKKAKTTDSVDQNDDVKEGQPENGAGAAEVTADGKEAAEGAQDGGESSIAQENKEIADNTAVASKKGQQRRLEVGESLPAGLVLKNENDEEVKVEELTREKGAVFFVYPKVRADVLLLRSLESQSFTLLRTHTRSRTPSLAHRQTLQDALLRLALLEISTKSLGHWATMVSGKCHAGPQGRIGSLLAMGI